MLSGFDVLTVLVFSILICAPRRHGVLELFVYASGALLFFHVYSTPGLTLWTCYAGLVSLLRYRRV